MICMLCGENIKIKKDTMPPAIARDFPNARPLKGVFDDWEMSSHMTFVHGFSKVRRNNTGKTSEAYYCVVEEVEINGTTYQWGDYVEKVNGKVMHYPGSLFPDRNVIQLSAYAEGTIVGYVVEDESATPADES